MANTPNLDELKKLNNRLTSLLDDPQGCSTWHEAVARVVKEIAEFA